MASGSYLQKSITQCIVTELFFPGARQIRCLHLHEDGSTTGFRNALAHEKLYDEQSSKKEYSLIAS